MKVLSIVVLVILGAVAVAQHGGVPGAASKMKPPTPSSDEIGIIVENNAWSITALNRIAFDYLTQAGEKLPNEPNARVNVRIMPKNPEVMCQVVYSQGFERPVWTVSIGYDGKAKSFRKSTKKEGSE